MAHKAWKLPVPLLSCATCSICTMLLRALTYSAIVKTSWDFKCFGITCPTSVKKNFKADFTILSLEQKVMLAVFLGY